MLPVTSILSAGWAVFRNCQLSNTWCISLAIRLHHHQMHRIPADRLPGAHLAQRRASKPCANRSFLGIDRSVAGTQAFSLAASKQMLSIPGPLSLCANRLAPGAFPGLPTISPDIMIDRLGLHLVSPPPEGPQAWAKCQTLTTLRQNP